MAIGLLGAVASTATMLPIRPPDLFGRAPDPAGIITADPGAVAVIDGETLRLHDSVVRLRGVTAPARGSLCHRPDGTAHDCGVAAARALASVVRGRAVRCRLEGRDPRGLPQANCEAEGANVNRAIVASGWARSVADGVALDPGLATEQAQAKASRLGAWSEPGGTWF